MDEAEGLQEIVIAEEVLLRGDADSMSVVEALARGVQAGASECRDGPSTYPDEQEAAQGARG